MVQGMPSPISSRNIKGFSFRLGVLEIRLYDGRLARGAGVFTFPVWCFKAKSVLTPFVL